MIDTIEDRIQWLDFQLSDAPDSGLNEEQTRACGASASS
jgi:hypothetical protein